MMDEGRRLANPGFKSVPRLFVDRGDNDKNMTDSFSDDEILSSKLYNVDMFHSRKRIHLPASIGELDEGVHEITDEHSAQAPESNVEPDNETSDDDLLDYHVITPGSCSFYRGSTLRSRIRGRRQSNFSYSTSEDDGHSIDDIDAHSLYTMDSEDGLDIENADDGLSDDDLLSLNPSKTLNEKILDQKAPNGDILEQKAPSGVLLNHKAPSDQGTVGSETASTHQDLDVAGTGDSMSQKWDTLIEIMTDIKANQESMRLLLESKFGQEDPVVKLDKAWEELKLDRNGVIFPMTLSYSLDSLREDDEKTAAFKWKNSRRVSFQDNSRAGVRHSSIIPVNSLDPSTSASYLKDNSRAGVRHSSIIPAPPASVFGDDDEDFRRVKKSQDAEERRLSEADTNFGTATLSKSAKNFAEVQNVVSEIERANSVLHDGSSQGTADADSSEHSGETSPETSDDTGHETMGSGDWQKFARTRFQLKTTHSYTCAMLQGSLLLKRDKTDTLASLAAWVSVLRIMGDLPEVDYGESFAVAGQTKPVAERLQDFFNRKYTRKDVDDSFRKYTELFKDPVGCEVKNIPFLPDNRESMLEKLQYVTAMGIYKADLRDELYCQVCKQLTNNPSRNSTLRGWVLLYIFAGSFLPSERFAPHFLQFLNDGPVEHAQRVERLLRRTFMVGTRGQPPSWLEFQASKNCKPILIPVILMDNKRFLLEADAATTVNELCAKIAQRIGMVDRSGFSIYITLGPRIACLGHGLHRIMDAIAECEQHTRDQGMRESSSTWRLYFRKEFFVPWHDPGDDKKATELTYQQIMRGVSVGEYKCEKDSVLTMMAAQKYFIDHGADVDEKKLEKFLNSWLPKEHSSDNNITQWIEKVKAEITNDFLKDQPNIPSLKCDIVTFAMNKWYNLFSRFYDVTKIHGPGLSSGDVIIGINCKGFNVMDERENVKAHVSFIEIKSVSKGRHTVTLCTIQGDEYVASTHHSEDLFSLLTSFQTGLRRRSRYAVAVQDGSHFESAIGFGVAKGDLVHLDKPHEEFVDSDVYTGVTVKNNKKGGVPRDLLYILPTVEEPPNSVMGMLAVQIRKDTLLPSGLVVRLNTEREQHTLHEYSKVFFRQQSESTVGKLLSKTSLKRKDKDNLWKFSKEPMRKPLLRRTNMRDELRRAACRSFNAIQTYMGEAQRKGDIMDSEMVNEFIIDVSMRNKYLRDEIVCQIMKQLTQNPNTFSEVRGWQILCLLVSSTYPTSDLYDELELFLQTNKHPLAKECLTRLHHTKSLGCRYNPPHPMEHEALIKRIPKIEYTVLFPDQTKQTVDVDGGTTMVDIHAAIVKKQKLRNPEEYGLFFGLKDRVINVAEGDVFFDFLTHIQRFYVTRPSPSASPEASPTLAPPMLIFMKKLWLNAVPGQDKLADIKFHFPQEIPNYMRGYHKCSPEDAVKLGALLFRAKYGDEKQPFESISNIIPTLIPKSVYELRDHPDWKKLLQDEITKWAYPTKDDAKVAFLKELSKWKTYGSVFFEVKQRSVRSLPKLLIIGINANGVSLVDAGNRDVLVTYSFDKVPNWAFDDFSFTLVVAEGAGINKIYAETSVGHNMDDLIMSYVAYIMNSQIKKKPSYAGIVVGESNC